ncbi:glycoside hydrolase superfamily [Dactylonectria estremocensis]|uniref:beta-glucosidase n=1 Tax=Dactylonectria estremocensis TaxID=1079267 RepID=A0A9P9DQC2_9HYPO|nr:glycoside hydrolase superfamily [Dactylonectria estremocensis]
MTPHASTPDAETIKAASNAAAILKQLTLEEKAALCGGQDWWRTVSIHRADSLLLPHIKMTDGPNGARGESYVSGVKAACFPCAESIAASFDTELAFQAGKEVALEARSKSADVLLAPTVCLVRSPLGGRNHETYGEDPHVLGTMGAAYVNGCQSVGVAATPKHFVANEIEQRRRFISAEISERALREIYLYPFQLILKDADPWCWMTSYNKVNDTYASENPRLLDDILRKEWGFDGLVMSDWVGTYTTVEAINAGLDLEMPAPLFHRGEKLLKAVQNGQVTIEVLDERARRVIELVQKTIRLREPEDKPEVYRVSPERDEFIARASTEGIVLLKNANGVLPLKSGARVAVIGQHAILPAVGGGGSARVPVDHLVTPLQGLEAAGVNFTHELGVPVYGAVPVPVLAVMSPSKSSHQPGSVDKPVRIEWFNGLLIGQNLVKEDMVEKSEYMIKERWPAILNKAYCTRMTFDLTPETAGEHTFSVVTTGTASLFVDGEKIYHREQEPVLQRESFYFFRPKIERLVTHKMEANRRYTITLESWAAPWEIAKGSIGGEVTQGSAVGFLEFVDIPARLRAAAEASEKSDVTIVFTGTTSDLESEGFDRSTMNLKPHEYDLIKAVAAANPNTVIVNTSGSPVSLHQIYDDVAGILQAWFPGQEAGTSITRILTGQVNPSGRLPVSWPRLIEDTPSYRNWPGDDNDVIRYEEGIFLGYRHYDNPDKPDALFPFGYGLSYTTFDKVSLDVAKPAVLGEKVPLEVQCTVANTGAVAGRVVVQFYIRRLEHEGNSVSKFTRPVKELKGFRKSSLLEPGATAGLRVSFDKYAVSSYDTESSCWRAEDGTYEIMAGFSSQDIVATATFQVEEGFTWTGL